MIVTGVFARIVHFSCSPAKQGAKQAAQDGHSSSLLNIFKDRLDEHLYQE